MLTTLTVFLALTLATPADANPRRTSDVRHGGPTTTAVRPAAAHQGYRSAPSRPHVHAHAQYQRYQPSRWHARGNAWSPAFHPGYRPGWHWVSGYWVGRSFVPGYWVPATTYPGHVWVPGYWSGHVYVEGYWRPAALAGYVWMDGSYDRWGNWIPGTWVHAPRGRARGHYR